MQKGQKQGNRGEQARTKAGGAGKEAFPNLYAYEKAQKELFYRLEGKTSLFYSLYNFPMATVCTSQSIFLLNCPLWPKALPPWRRIIYASISIRLFCMFVSHVPTPALHCMLLI